MFYHEPEINNYFYTKLHQTSSTTSEFALEAMRELPPTTNTLRCYFSNFFNQTNTYKSLTEAGKLDVYEEYVAGKLGVGVDELCSFISSSENLLKMKEVFGVAIDPHVVSYDGIECPRELIDCDIVNRISFDYDVIELVVERCDFLMNNHPMLWTEELQLRYRGYFLDIYDTFDRSTIPEELLLRCTSIFPSVRVSAKSELGLDIELAKKYLGFEESVCDEAVKEKYAILGDELEREKFLEGELEKTKEYLKKFPTARNTTNLSSLEPLENFYVRDIVDYVDDRGFVYLFTLDECTPLLISKINPYNTLPLSHTFLSKIAGKHGSSYTISDGLTKLYEKHELKDLVNQHPRMNPLSQYFHQERAHSTTQNTASKVAFVSGTLYTALFTWRMAGGIGLLLGGITMISCTIASMTDDQIDSIKIGMRSLKRRVMSYFESS